MPRFSGIPVEAEAPSEAPTAGRRPRFGGILVEQSAPASQPAAETPPKRPASAEPPRIYVDAGTDAMGGATGMTDIAPSEEGYGGVLASAGRAADDTVRMIANGMTFGLADRAAGLGDLATGQAESYDAGVRAQRDRTQQVRDERPVLATAGELAGGLATGVGLARNGVTLAGRVGAGLIPRAAAFGAEGAAYGAATGAGNTYSENVGDYLENARQGAKWGFGIGAALPVAGMLVGSGVRGAKAVAGPGLQGAGRRASAILRGAAQADEEGLRRLASMGDEAMLVDAGPSMLGLGQGAATGIGPGRSALVNNLRTRDQGTNRRLAAVTQEALGPAPIPSRVEADLDRARGSFGRLYDEAFSRARAVDTTPLAERLEQLAVNTRGPGRGAAESVRSMLNIHGTDVLDPNPQALHQTRMAIDGMIRSETDTNALRVLNTARRQVDAMLTDAVPGIKSVDAQIRELHRQSEGLTTGGAIFDTGRNNVIRPAEFQDILQTGAVAEGRMVGPSGAAFRARQGARAEVDRQIGTNINDLNVLERTMATAQDWSNQKLRQVFGDGPVDVLSDALATNRRFRDSYQRISEGTQTAQRRSASEALEGKAQVPMDMTVMGAGVNAARSLARILLNAQGEVTKDQVGRILSAVGPEARALVEELLGPAVAARQQSAAATRAVANPGTAAVAGQYGGRR